MLLNVQPCKWMGLTPMGFGEYGSYDDPLMLDANCSATPWKST